MINLDAIIPYQPPPPHKPPKSSKIAPLPSKPPPLIHPLPQKPNARDQSSLSPFQSCQPLSSITSIPVDQEQTSRRPSSTNAFDRELAAWSDMSINHTTIMSTAAEDQGKGRQSRNGSDGVAGNSESRYPDIRCNSPGISAESREPERPRSPHEESTRLIHGSQRDGTHDSAASDFQSENAILVAIAHSNDVEALHMNDYASDLQSAGTLMLQPDVDVRGSGLESRDIPGDGELTPNALPLNMVPSVSGDTGLTRQDQNDDHDDHDTLLSCEGDHLTSEPASIHSKEPSPSPSVSSERNGICPRENCAVAVVIPAAQPPQPRKRTSRLRTKTQTYRTDPLDESDELDDSDDDDYVDRSQHVEHQRRSTKRPKYQPIANSDPVKPEAVRDFKLGDLSLPNLRTVQRGVLTCEFFPSQIMYSFSWAEDRGCSDDRPPNDDNTLSKGDGRSETSGIQGWGLDTSSKDVKDATTEKIDDNQRHSRLNSRKPGRGGKRRRKKAWTDEEDARLKLLKEEKNMSWSQILKHFPDRKQGTVQFRYYNVLRDSTSKSSVISSHGATDRNNTPPSSPHSDRQERIDSSSQSAMESTLRSRYGPARRRRTILSLLNGPVLAIQRQSNGEESDDDDGDDKEDTAAETVPIRISERRYIAECVVRGPSVLRDQKGYAFHVEFSVAMIALSKRRDRRPVKTRCSPAPVPVKTVLDPPRLSEIEPIVKRDTPLKCQGWQCLICLASYDLPLEERKREDKRKYTLQKYVDRCRLQCYGPDDLIPYPGCPGLILNMKDELKAHFIHVHDCIL